MKESAIKRVNITLSAKTLQTIDQVAKKGNRSQFIDTAVNFYVYEIGRKNVAKALKEGAVKHTARDQKISEEWFNLDGKAW